MDCARVAGENVARAGFAERVQPRVSATTIQTVGRKGHDGFTLALVEPL